MRSWRSVRMRPPSSACAWSTWASASIRFACVSAWMRRACSTWLLMSLTTSSAAPRSRAWPSETTASSNRPSARLSRARPMSRPISAINRFLSISARWVRSSPSRRRSSCKSSSRDRTRMALLRKLMAFSYSCLSADACARSRRRWASSIDVLSLTRRSRSVSRQMATF